MRLRHLPFCRGDDVFANYRVKMDTEAEFFPPLASPFYVTRLARSLARSPRLRETDGHAMSGPVENLRVYTRVPGPLLDYIQHLRSDRHNSIPNQTRMALTGHGLLANARGQHREVR